MPRRGSSRGCLLRPALREAGLGDCGRGRLCRMITAALTARRSYAARSSWIGLLMSEGAGPSAVPGASTGSGCAPGPQWPGTWFACSWECRCSRPGPLNRRFGAASPGNGGQEDVSTGPAGPSAQV